MTAVVVVVVTVAMQPAEFLSELHCKVHLAGRSVGNGTFQPVEGRLGWMDRDREDHVEPYKGWC